VRHRKVNLAQAFEFHVDISDCLVLIRVVEALVVALRRWGFGTDDLTAKPELRDVNTLNFLPSLCCT
jgi:hypothetical protein